MPEKFDVSDNSWFVWSKHVLMQLERNSKCLNEIKQELTLAKIEIARLKVKSGVWGAIGGAIPVCVAIGLWLVTKK